MFLPLPLPLSPPPPPRLIRTLNVSGMEEHCGEIICICLYTEVCLWQHRAKVSNESTVIPSQEREARWTSIHICQWNIVWLNTYGRATSNSLIYFAFDVPIQWYVLRSITSNGTNELTTCQCGWSLLNGQMGLFFQFRAQQTPQTKCNKRVWARRIPFVQQNGDHWQ